MVAMELMTVALTSEILNGTYKEVDGHDLEEGLLRINSMPKLKKTSSLCDHNILISIKASLVDQSGQHPESCSTGIPEEQ